MPNLDSKFQHVAGSTSFGNIDLALCYWQVLLSPESQEMMQIQTPIGVYSSRRLLQGGSDSGNHFQAVLQQKFDERVDNMLQWIEDFLFYAKDETELLNTIESFLSVCSEIGIKVSAEKPNLFSRKFQVCGRVISAEGIQLNTDTGGHIVEQQLTDLRAENEKLRQLFVYNDANSSSTPELQVQQTMAETLVQFNICT